MLIVSQVEEHVLMFVLEAMTITEFLKELMIHTEIMIQRDVKCNAKLQILMLIGRHIYAKPDVLATILRLFLLTQQS
jgi:hypothetical protein